MAVRNVLLGLLAQRPRHGYDLHSAFEALAGGQQLWALKPAQVYTTLRRLEEGGLITPEAIAQDGGPEKRIYALTSAGKHELREWLQHPVQQQHERDEFFLKFMVSLGTTITDPYVVIQAQRTGLYRELHTLVRERSALNVGVALATVLLIDRAIMHMEADIRWLDMLEARLDEIRKQGLPNPLPKPRGRPPRIES
jgi:DNA-binding PadR family transcriptional regulator